MGSPPGKEMQVPGPWICETSWSFVKHDLIGKAAKRAQGRHYHLTLWYPIGPVVYWIIYIYINIILKRMCAEMHTTAYIHASKCMMSKLLVCLLHFQRLWGPSGWPECGQRSDHSGTEQVILTNGSSHLAALKRRYTEVGAHVEFPILWNQGKPLLKIGGSSAWKHLERQTTLFHCGAMQQENPRN